MNIYWFPWWFPWHPHRPHHHHKKKKPPSPIRDLRAILQAPPKRTKRRIGIMSTAKLAWTFPTTRVDGSPLVPSDIARVDIYDGANVIGSVGAETAFSTGALDVGDHPFTAIVVDTTGHSSAPSNIATVTVPATLAAPSAISDLSATLVP